MDPNLLYRYNLISFEEIDSTNEEAKRLIRSGVLENFIIISKNQTKGVGRNKREWRSPDGNLNLTLVLETDINITKLHHLVFISGIALLDAINEICHKYTQDISDELKDLPEKPVLKFHKSSLKLKWPNDLMINDKKVAGILLESMSNAQRRFVIVGIGVNVIDYPILEGRSVCSIASECGVISDAEEIANLVVNKFDAYYEQWKKDSDFEAVRAYWLKHAYKISNFVMVDVKAGSSSSTVIFPGNGQQDFDLDLSEKSIVSGVFKEIDSEGAIVIQTDEKNSITLSQGEIKDDI